jgi:glutamate/tyrosine decarboxylase-like PLP-dependent enzyme
MSSGYDHLMSDSNVPKNVPSFPNRVSLPEKGVAREEVLQRLKVLREKDAKWHDGKTWSLVYHATDEHTDFIQKAYLEYFHENGLNPGAFPSLKKFENEVVSISALLLNGGDEAKGTMTSGGSESIMMAVKTYRDWARALYPEIVEPEMIACKTVHPAFEKAAHYFDVKIRHVGFEKDYRMSMAEVHAAITPNTILLVGSAPQYPHGVIDPIEQLSKLALERKIGLHVDACVGGFMLPFIEKLGHPVDSFDFRVPGVTSISADVHKYGFAAKGASVVLYRNADLRRFQFFVYQDWSGGLFASPTMTGTRPGGSIAAAWATLQAYGWDGYLAQMKQILETTRRLQNGISEIPGLVIVGKPVGPVFAFTTNEPSLSPFAIGDQLEARGWHVDRQQNPMCLHAMVTPNHSRVVDQYLKDLRDAVDYVRSHPEAVREGQAAMYGMLAEVGPGDVDQFLYGYMDERYQT